MSPIFLQLVASQNRGTPRVVSDRDIYLKHPTCLAFTRRRRRPRPGDTVKDGATKTLRLVNAIDFLAGKQPLFNSLHFSDVPVCHYVNYSKQQIGVLRAFNVTERVVRAANQRQRRKRRTEKLGKLSFQQSTISPHYTVSSDTFRESARKPSQFAAAAGSREKRNVCYDTVYKLSSF